MTPICSFRPFTDSNVKRMQRIALGFISWAQYLNEFAQIENETINGHHCPRMRNLLAEKIEDKFRYFFPSISGLGDQVKP